MSFGNSSLDDDGGRVELPRAALRFAFALLGAAALGRPGGPRRA